MFTYWRYKWVMQQRLQTNAFNCLQLFFPLLAHTHRERERDAFFKWSIFFLAKLLELVLFAVGLFDSSMFVDAIFGISLQKNATYILSDLFSFLFKSFTTLFPPFHGSDDFLDGAASRSVPCSAGFNLIFLINSNSFKYMHQQQFTLDKQCALVFGIQATALTTATASFHISKMSKFVVYLRANIKSIQPIADVGSANVEPKDDSVWNKALNSTILTVTGAPFCLKCSHSPNCKMLQ